MGTQLIKGYTIEKDSKGTIGAQNNWKIHDATKQGSNQPASVLIIQKKSLPKADKQEIIKISKKQATSLAKFRHPNVISITQALLQDEYSLGFVTQRLQGNLKLLIQSGKFINHCSSELELKIHIVELLQALSFLHNNVKLVHNGINLNNIYITPDGKWKLGGFVFSQTLSGEGLYDCETKPNDFCYLSPEVAIQSKCSYASDIFSLMTVALTVLEHIKHPSRQLTPLINASNKNQYEKHKEIFSRIDRHPFIGSSQSPNELGKLANETLCWEWSKRRSISQVSNCEYLNDNFTITIKHLDSIINLEQKMQLQFLKGLSAMVLKFQPSLIKKKIIPTLLELMKFDYLISGILMTIIELMKKQIISVPEFQKTIWGQFKVLMQGKEISAHALYLFVNNIQIFTKYISLQDLNTTLIPLYIKCFDCPNKLKQLALRKVEFLFKKLQYQFIKSKILPKILSLMVDKTPQIRKGALICIYKSATSYDPQVITDQILPNLDKLRKAGSDSFNNAITLKLYIVFSKNLSIQIIGNKIIPSLVPYLVDSGISNSDFQLYKNTINNLMAKIQNERTKNPSAVEGPVYTEADFDFPQQERQKQYIKPQIQANFNFLSMFKGQVSQNVRPQIQQPVITQTSNLGYKQSNDFGFGGFSSPTNNLNINHEYSNKPNISNSLNFDGFSNNEAKPQTLQIPNSQQKTLDAAADQFFNFIDDKPKPVNPPKQKFNLKGPPSNSNKSLQPQVSQPSQGLNLYSPALNNSSQPQNLYNTNQGFKVEEDPFAQLQRQMKQSKDINDFGDFSQAPTTYNNFGQSQNQLNPNFNNFQTPTQFNYQAQSQPPANNFNLNTNFLGPPSHQTGNKLTIAKPSGNTTKNVNQISGDSFFDLL